MNLLREPEIDTNLFIFTSWYVPPTGGDLENRQETTVGGIIMDKTLQRYREYLCGEHEKINTVENKLTAVRILLHQTQGVLTRESMTVFKAWANQHYRHNSRNNRINAWNQFLRWAGYPDLQMKHVGFIETNQYALSEEEMDRMLTASQAMPLERLVLLCLFDGAMRPSEIIDIQMDRRDGNRLYLDDTKTGDKRVIMSPLLIEAWDRYLQVRPGPLPGQGGYLILKDGCKQTGMKYLDTGPVNDIVKRIAARAGVQKGLTAYTVRRTSATLRQCRYSRYYMGDDKLVQMLFRHKDLATTKRYDRTTDLDIERYFNDLGDRDKQGACRINPGVSGVNRKDGDINKIYAYHDVVCFPQEIFIYDGEGDCCSFSFSVSFSLSVTSYWGVSGLVMGFGVLPHIPAPLSSHGSFLEYGSCAVGDGRVFFLSHLDPPYFQSISTVFIAPPRITDKGQLLGVVILPCEQMQGFCSLLWCSNHGQVMAQGLSTGGYGF